MANFSSPNTATTASLVDGATCNKPSPRMVALTTEDILREIFHHFDITNNSNHIADNRVTLLRAALTCKAFVEPALDALWWSMSSITPIMKLSPLNLQTIENTHHTLTFSGGLSGRGWARFDYHSRRVRDFCYYPAPIQEVTTAALLYFSRHRPIIFPHLRNVAWATSAPPSVMLLVSPSLGSLEITGVQGNDPGVLTTLLSVLGHHPQSLTKITLRGSIPAQCLTLVPKISSLSTVIVSDHVGLLSLAFLRGLGALKCLQCLHINLTIAPPTFLDHIGFLALRTLRISGLFDWICEFVTTLASEQITSISVLSTGWSARPSGEKATRGHPPTGHTSREPHPEGLLKHVAARWHHLDYVDFDLPAISPKRPNTTSYTLLQPFRNHHSLDTISIRGFSRLPSSDQDIVDIGTSWPMIQTLIIPFSPFPIDSDAGSGTHTTTILGLRQFAELCPRLTHLQLSLDVHDLPTLTGDPLTHGLQTLSVGDSPIGDPFLVAKHLDCLFPYLTTVSGSNPVANVGGSQVTTDPTRDGWELVERILHNCQAGRANEYKRTEMRRARREFSTHVGRPTGTAILS